ncbi:hypothetical protein A2947_03305 [Candidatus Peribacteria bacterium RIFCSPLOWO2_01_FULL_54_110]|nr:MAG: hypothetical protein A2947_03305 [Candidatus Peribacteria bacterium RIFCSPLOWO2_01_FULL_54_110]
MTYKHLQEQSYYEELYDRHTVEDCRWYEEPRPMSKEENDAKKGLTPGQIQWGHDFVTDFLLFQCAGDRYLRRAEMINEWMERDGQRDAMLERARTPLIRCPSCGRAMDCVYKHLDYDIDNKRSWVEFILACQPCKQSKRVLENGEEIPEKPSLCVKCKKEVELSTRKKNGKEYLVNTCKNCGHIEETLSVLDREKKEPTQEDIERFEYDKKRFCLTSTQGGRYKHWIEGMKRMGEVKKEQEANVEYYDKLAEVKKLTIAGLEKMLKKAVKKVGYDDLRITMPAPTDREIVINFSVRDLKDNREEYESTKTLQKTIAGSLDNTNWSLTSDGPHYRLGLLSGRICGYESEPDLEALTKSRMKKMSKKQKIAA